MWICQFRTLRGFYDFVFVLYVEDLFRMVMVNLWSFKVAFVGGPKGWGLTIEYKWDYSET